MGKEQKKLLWVLILLSAVYFTIFVFPNAKGVQDANMLAVFEVDEFAQYPHVIRMLTPGDTLYQTIRNFLIYLHYFYGYVFYFCSALVLLPIRLWFGSDWVGRTQLIMTTLRQMINVFPMIVSILLLVYMQTRYKQFWKSIFLFVFLLSVPVVVVNNLWWHPDSLVFLFIVLTLFFLQCDDFRYGKNLWFAAAACGLATGTKDLGLFFVLAVPVYLMWGVIRRDISWKRGMILAVLFVVVMVLAVVISNPLLLLPMERAEIVATQKMQFQQTSSGLIFSNLEPFMRWGEYPEDFRIHYGEWCFVLSAFAALVIGIISPARRSLNVLILSWILPLTATVFLFATRRTHYLLTAAIPLYSCLVNFFDFDERQIPLSVLFQKNKSFNLKIAAMVLMVVLLVFQFVIFVRQDVQIVSQYWKKEETSSAIVFYGQLEEKVLSRIDREGLVIYRDWRIYVPPDAASQIVMDWEFASLERIAELNPDLILLEKENLNAFSRPEVVQKAIDPGDMKRTHEFYRLALSDSLVGYRIVFKNSFGQAMVREEIFSQEFE